MPTDLSETRRIDSTLKYIQDKNYSLEKVTVLAAQDLAAGEVIGKITAGTVPTTGTAGGTNTGNGTMTSVTGGTQVKVGVYTATCVAAATNAGAFAVKDPNGLAVGTAYVGGAFTSDQINFTVNDGSTDFVLGDYFTVTVPAGGAQVRAINFSGVDGSAVAYGIMYAPCDASATGHRTLAYTSGGTYEIVPGDTITGATSSATARVISLTLSSGTWAGGDAAGTLTLDTQVGTFQSENLNVGSNSNVATIAGNSAAVAAADKAGVAVVRGAGIVTDYLTWPSGATAAQKAQALSELADKDITTFTSG